MCPNCRVRVRAEVFPALSANPHGEVRLGEEIVVDGQSSCFYHPNKKAEIHCDGCGRFLCALCDVSIGSEHYCTQCVEAGVKRGKVDKLKRGEMQHDRLALSLAIAGLVPIPFIMLFPPLMSIYFALRYWNKSESVVRRSRWFKIAAVLISLIGIAFQSMYLLLFMRGEHV